MEILWQAIHLKMNISFELSQTSTFCKESMACVSSRQPCSQQRMIDIFWNIQFGSGLTSFPLIFNAARMATNRPEYRDARTPRAVKAYCIAQESRYLIVENVPALGVTENLLKMCSAFGAIQEHRMLDDHPHADQFTDVVWIKFETAMGARMAKRGLDDKPFFSNLLRISYAVEYESEQDIRQKLKERKAAVAHRLTAKAPKKRKQPEPAAPVPPIPAIGPQTSPSSAKFNMDQGVGKETDSSLVAVEQKVTKQISISAKPKRRRI